MENRQQQILAEIQSMMASIRNELNMLDIKISEFQQIAGASGNEPEPIDLEHIDFTMEATVEQVVETEMEMEIEPEIEPEVDVEVEAEPEVEVEPVEEEEPEVIEVPVAEEVVEADVEADVELVSEVEEVDEPEVVTEPDVDDDLPFFEEESVFAEPAKPEPVKVEPVAPKEEATALIDAMLDKFAWKNDMPGSAVKDVRSAISLNDRILFINKLFAEDPMAFQAAIGKLNAMESLDDVVAYVQAEHSDWNLESDVVYRFMMAVRRKVR
jgi:hypothetical protein